MKKLFIFFISLSCFCQVKSYEYKIFNNTSSEIKAKITFGVGQDEALLVGPNKFGTTDSGLKCIKSISIESSKGKDIGESALEWFWTACISKNFIWNGKKLEDVTKKEIAQAELKLKKTENLLQSSEISSDDWSSMVDEEKENTLRALEESKQKENELRFKDEQLERAIAMSLKEQKTEELLSRELSDSELELLPFEAKIDSNDYLDSGDEDMWGFLEKVSESEKDLLRDLSDQEVSLLLEYGFTIHDFEGFSKEKIQEIFDSLKSVDQEKKLGRKGRKIEESQLETSDLDGLSDLDNELVGKFSIEPSFLDSMTYEEKLEYLELLEQSLAESEVDLDNINDEDLVEDTLED